MSTIEAIELIARNEAIRNGRPYIVGTTITVADVAIAKVYRMQIPEQIAEWYDLALPQVYAALAYYYAHKAEIDSSIAERCRFADEFKEQRIGSRYPPLFG